jgi:hypothetical protein
VKATILRAAGLAALMAALAACSSDGGGGGSGGDAGPTPGNDMGVQPGHDMGPACTAGAEGCPCGAMAPCPDGTTCQDGQCVEAMPMHDLAVSDPNARSCELYFRESGDGRVTGAHFGDGVRGRWLRQAPGVAVVFVREADDAFPAGSVALQVSGAANGVALQSVACADRLGRALPGVTVTLQ